MQSDIILSSNPPEDRRGYGELKMQRSIGVPARLLGLAEELVGVARGGVRAKSCLWPMQGI